MALALEHNWRGDLHGLLITRYGHGAPCERIEIVEAGHPVPDAAGAVATQRIKALVSGLTGDDLVICLLSGGGSALLVDPPTGMTLEEKQALTQALLLSGATIGEINCVRKHLSGVKGGRLALAAAPARVITLAISDVPGDQPALIASGPTVADPSTRREAIDVLTRHGIKIPAPMASWLNDPASETPKTLCAASCAFQIIAAPAMALDAAAAHARSAGWQVHILGDAIEGEARNVGRQHAEIARNMLMRRMPSDPPCVLLSGGETTVTVRGQGRGGRNTEYLLALTAALDGAPGVHALAADTDGIDGTEKNAGAEMWPQALSLAASRGRSADACLAANDSYGFFEAIDGLVFTGPTRTNVNDFRAIAITHAGH